MRPAERRWEIQQAAQGEISPRGQRFKGARVAEVTPLDGTSIRALGVPADVGEPDPQGALILVGARQPHKRALQCRGIGLPDKHSPDRDDDRSQRSALVGRNDGGDATTTPGANLRKRTKGSVRRRRGTVQQVHTQTSGMCNKQGARATAQEERTARAWLYDRAHLWWDCAARAVLRWR